MMLCLRIFEAAEGEPNIPVPNGRREASPVVGSCYMCRDMKRKQRKNRKYYTNCMQPVCIEDSIATTTCISCKKTRKRTQFNFYNIF